MEESRFPPKGQKCAPDQFTVFTVRISEVIVYNLYKHSDKHYKGKVNILTDKILNDYMDTHLGDRMLTDYVGENKGGKLRNPYYKYNLQIRQSTRDRLNDMADEFQVARSVIAGIALKIWMMGLK